MNIYLVCKVKIGVNVYFIYHIHTIQEKVDRHQVKFIYMNMALFNMEKTIEYVRGIIREISNIGKHRVKCIYTNFMVHFKVKKDN
jgi:hypothetical protein